MKKWYIILSIVFIVLAFGLLLTHKTIQDNNNILENFPSECNVSARCGDIVGINCKAEVDGPYYYVDKNTHEIISRCGGYCMMGCENCPPQEWSCN